MTGSSVLTKHFDVIGLLAAVHDQPIGLAVSTNHPQGFRRLCYLGTRTRPDLKVQILQSPKSSTMFLLVKDGVDVNAAVIEAGEGEQDGDQAGKPEVDPAA